MLSGQIRRGDEYAKLKRAICIVITDFVLIDENSEYRNDYYLHDGRTGSQFSDKLNIVVLELPKLKDEDQTLLADWLRFLNMTEENDMEELAKKDQTIRKAVGRYKELTADERERMIAESHWWWLMDQKAREDFVRDEGIEKGFEEGVEQGVKQGLATGIEQGVKQGIEQGIKQGVKQGLATGIEQNRLENARRMKSDNMDMALIAKYTGLSELEIENL
jgi:predicted transposase/invertase (TIGR01784 family)